MSEEKLDRIEVMLSQLINTVGKIREEQTEMKNEISGIKTEISGIKEDQQQMKKDIYSISEAQLSMREENDKRHQEVLERFSSLEADQDHIWKKAVTNERDFAKFKIQYGI